MVGSHSITKMEHLWLIVAAMVFEDETHQDFKEFPRWWWSIDMLTYIWWPVTQHFSSLGLHIGNDWPVCEVEAMAQSKWPGVSHSKRWISPEYFADQPSPVEGAGDGEIPSMINFSSAKKRNQKRTILFEKQPTNGHLGHLYIPFWESPYWSRTNNDGAKTYCI